MGSIRGDVLYGWLLIRNDPSNSSIIRNDVLTTMELDIKMFVIFLKDAKWSNQINFNNETGGYEVGPTCEEAGKECPGKNLGIVGNQFTSISCLQYCKDNVEGCSWVSHSKSHNVCILYGDDCNADNLVDDAEYSTSELSCLPQCTVQNGLCEVGGLFF